MKEPAPTRLQLQSILESQKAPDDKGWAIYRFLKDNIGDKMPSTEARTLLLAYLRLQTARPSLLHSLMLGVAIKAAEAYPDFKLPAFVDMWSIDHLRQDDYERRHDESGRIFHSLAQRLAIALLRYATTHPDVEISDKAWTLALEQGNLLGFLTPRPMIAVKMFESEHQGRKVRMVKLIGGDGIELSTDWRLFHAKPWEITGRMYTVLPRIAEKSGNKRVDTVGPSIQTADEVFGRVIGFVDSYDARHKHYHIYDSDSRHFVAEAPALRIGVGDYVWFAPVVPADDPFKSAIVIAAETKEAGRRAFGAIEARVLYINTEKEYFAYTTDGSDKAFAKIKCATRDIAAGDTIHLTRYMRRSADKEKRPFVGEAY